MFEDELKVAVQPGWYSHPMIGLMRVYEAGGMTRYCGIRKDRYGRFTSMRPNILSESIAKKIKIVPIPPGIIEDKKHMPSDIKGMYHDIISDRVVEAEIGAD